MKDKDERFYHCLFKAVACYIIILSQIYTLQGQPVNKWLTRPIYLPDTYSSRNINDILLDHTGLIWIADDSGLNIYDGLKYNRYNNGSIHAEGDTKVFQLAEDDECRLWILGDRGLSLLDKQRKKQIEAKYLGIPDSVLTSPNLNFCQGDNKEIFILSGLCIYRWRKKKLELWSRYHSQYTLPRERAIMIFSKKNEKIHLYLPNQYIPENRLWIYQKDGRIIDPEKKLNKKINTTDGFFNFTLTDAFGDSVTIFSKFQAGQPPIISKFSNEYSTVYHTSVLPHQIQPLIDLKSVYKKLDHVRNITQ